MIERIRAIRIWFESLSQRERFVLIGAAVAGIVLLGEWSSWGSGRERLTSAGTQLGSLQDQRDSLENELAQLDQSEALDPDAAARHQLARLKEEIAGIDEDLRLNTLQILTPDQARSVFRDMIASVRGIRLLGMRVEPPEMLVNASMGDLPTLFRHGLIVELEGEYLSLLDYARELEELPWNFYWLGLEVDAATIGPRRFRLHLYTVSLRKEWIGV